MVTAADNPDAPNIPADPLVWVTATVKLPSRNIDAWGIVAAVRSAKAGKALSI